MPPERRPPLTGWRAQAVVALDDAGRRVRRACGASPCIGWVTCRGMRGISGGMTIILAADSRFPCPSPRQSGPSLCNA